MSPRGQRVVLGRKGISGFTKVVWTDECPDEINNLEWAEELGAVWEGEELVTYDLDAMKDLISYYENDDYMYDND